MRGLILVILFFIISWYSISAQLKTDNSEKDKRNVGDPINGDWSFGIGFNVVDDGGVILGGLFEPKKYSHFQMPIIVQVEYFYNSQFSFFTSISINKYVEDKIVDRRGIILKNQEPSYFAADLGTKFYFRDIFSDYVFEPYIFLGLGYTHIGGHRVNAFSSIVPNSVLVETDGKWKIPSVGNMTFNSGLGVNYWFSKNWGINLNVAGKWGLIGKKNEDIISNQTQFAIIAFYRLE